MALALTQPQTEMNTIKFPGDKDGRRIGVTTLLPSVSRMSEKVEFLNLSQSQGPPWHVQG
jgi:hypothetical protein